MPPARTPSVVRAVRRDLKELEKLQAGIASSALAATALGMAREIDDRENTASGMAACARVLDSVMAELRLSVRRAREQTPNLPEPPKDGLDEITARRTARRSAS